MAGTFRLAAGLAVAVRIPAQGIGNLPSVPGCNLGALGARVTSLNVVCCGSGPGSGGRDRFFFPHSSGLGRRLVCVGTRPSAVHLFAFAKHTHTTFEQERLACFPHSG